MSFLDDNPILEHLIFCMELGLRNDAPEYYVDISTIFTTIMNKITGIYDEELGY